MSYFPCLFWTDRTFTSIYGQVHNRHTLLSNIIFISLSFLSERTQFLKTADSSVVKNNLWIKQVVISWIFEKALIALESSFHFCYRVPFGLCSPKDSSAAHFNRIQLFKPGSLRQDIKTPDSSITSRIICSLMIYWCLVICAMPFQMLGKEKDPRIIEV